jgi:hypothetical protein
MATAYLEAQQKCFAAETIVSAEAIDALVFEMNRFKTASHILWAAWAIAKSNSCGIVFGYVEYAVARLDLFFDELTRSTRR